MSELTAVRWASAQVERIFLLDIHEDGATIFKTVHRPANLQTRGVIDKVIFHHSSALARIMAPVKLGLRLGRVEGNSQNSRHDRMLQLHPNYRTGQDL